MCCIIETVSQCCELILKPSGDAQFNRIDMQICQQCCAVSKIQLFAFFSASAAYAISIIESVVRELKLAGFCIKITLCFGNTKRDKAFTKRQSSSYSEKFIINMQTSNLFCYLINPVDPLLYSVSSSEAFQITGERLLQIFIGFIGFF